jgi:hypothetical protein
MEITTTRDVIGATIVLCVIIAIVAFALVGINKKDKGDN